MLHAYQRHRAHFACRPSDDLDTTGDVADVTDGLDACDAYVVLVVDPQTDAVDSYGPLTGPDAITEADRRRRDLDAGDLGDVEVRVVRHHALPVHG